VERRWSGGGAGKRRATDDNQQVREYLLCLMVAAAVTYLATPVVRALALRAGAYTHIRARDVHTTITPRWGGLGMFIGLLAAFAIARDLPMMRDVFDDMGTVYGLLGATALLVVIGLIDDRFDLDAPTKFAGQAMAAGVLAWQGIGFIWLPLGNATVLDPLTSTLLTLLVVLVCINAVNFVDGLDGLASGIVLVAGAASFIYSYLLSVHYGFERATLSTLISAILTGVCLGFLPHNVNPARIFMGDTGAMMLGLLLASCTVTLTGQVDPNALGDTSRASTVLPILLPLAALALPLIDLGLAVIRRTARGRSPMSPDREHLHHRLLDLGHSPRAAASIMHVGAAILAFSTVALAFVPWTYVAVVCTICLALLAVAIFHTPEHEDAH
jgi:UDP-GlcNAc:undecaprenyl-phosphate GlcNAc-1-phosphate transferase